MTCAGYAKYMEHIGAGTRLAHTFIRPLYRLNRPYIVLALMFLLNMGLSICVPNPLSLALLMMVTYVSRIASPWGEPSGGCSGYCYGTSYGRRTWCGIYLTHCKDP